MILHLLALAAQAPAVPPPVEQQTADCRAPVFATDQLVCGDPDLRALDSELAAVLPAASVPEMRWFEAQTQWFLRRSRCAFVEDHAACAAAAYRDRLVVLRPLDPAAPRVPARCNDPQIAALGLEDERTVLFDQAGAVLGTVTVSGKASGWQPFLAGERRGRKLTITPLAGEAITCRTAAAPR